MKNILRMFLAVYTCILIACEGHDQSSSEYYMLNTKSSSGFSFKNMEALSFPFSETNKPDFLLSVHINDAGDIVGAMLSNPDLENRFILIKKFDDLNSAQMAYDTLSVLSSSQLQPFALDITPFEIWQIKTNTGAMVIILIMETLTENINNTPYAEIKFKAKKSNP